MGRREFVMKQRLTQTIIALLAVFLMSGIPQKSSAANVQDAITNFSQGIYTAGAQITGVLTVDLADSLCTSLEYRFRFPNEILHADVTFPYNYPTPVGGPTTVAIPEVYVDFTNHGSANMTGQVIAHGYRGVNTGGHGSYYQGWDQAGNVASVFFYNPYFA